jgi:hypothetical protein
MQELVKEMDNIRDNWMPDVKNDTDELSMSWCMHMYWMATTERSREFHHNKIEKNRIAYGLYSDHFSKSEQNKFDIVTFRNAVM